MEPRHLKVLRRAAEAASAEAHRVECAARSHYDLTAAARWLKAAYAAERKACRAYARAYNAAVEGQ
jgi:hypothetical protein